jgi:hypothetical protein
MAALDGVKKELSDNEKQLVTDEITNDPMGKGYTNPSVKISVEELLNRKPLIDNPITEIDKPPVLLLDIIDDCGLTPEKIESIRNDVMLPGIWNFLVDFQNNINLASPTIKQAFDDIENAGHITAKQRSDVTAFGKMPNSTPKIKGKSRAEELLGDGIVVGGDDLK